MQERRRVDRTEIDEVAYIAGDGSSMRCRVLNISSQGAAVEVPDPTCLRLSFKLMIERDRQIRNCRLIWKSGNRIGLEFVDEDEPRQPS